MRYQWLFPEKMYSALWGFFIGDALGVPFEFTSREEMKDNPAIDMVGFGTHNQPPGTWSDDSSLLLSVFENISKLGDTKELGLIFKNWYCNAHNSARGDVFDVGISTREAIQRLIDGVPAEECGSDHSHSAGNGSLMRCLPYAFMHESDRPLERMRREGRITHALDICHEASMYFVRFAKLLLSGVSQKEAFETLQKETEKCSPEFNRLFHPGFLMLQEEDIKSGGYVVDTLEASIWCFMKTGNYKDAVLSAVNLGNDTDTVSALTGGLAGLYYGFTSIPSEWRMKLAGAAALDREFRFALDMPKRQKI